MDSRDKSGNTIDFRHAKIVSTYNDLNLQIKDNDDVISRLTRRLQTSLDITEIVSMFATELKEIVDFSQFCYEHTDGESTIVGGVSGAHSCHFNLAMDTIRLGSMKLSRRQRFAEEELSIIEYLASTLVFPVRNAILYQQALSSAMKDELTGCGNRRALQSSLHRETERALRHKYPLSIMMIDIDHFKAINDSYGHPCGDTVIKDLATLLKKQCRQSDLCFRYGGEEFLIILDESDCKQSLAAAERIRKHIMHSEVLHEAARIKYTVSIGVACFNAGDTLDQLMTRADQALYRSKNSGRNCSSLARAQTEAPVKTQVKMGI